MARLSGKLTAKSLGWDRNRIGTAVKKVPQDTGRVELGTFVGIVSGLRQTVNNDTGEVQNGLKGQFRGVSTLGVDPDKAVSKNNAANRITAGVCYLPGGIQDMIEGQLAKAKEHDASATVQFGLKLFAIPATNKAGYSFDAESLVAAQEADPLDTLLEMAEKAEPQAIENMVEEDA